MELSALTLFCTFTDAKLKFLGNSLQRAQQLCTSTHAATEGPYFVEGAPQGNGSICDYRYLDTVSAHLQSLLFLQHYTVVFNFFALYW